MPVILRNMGTSLQLVGGLFLLHLPWALKFLYASWVDRYYIPAIGRRRSWIFPLQWLGALILLCVSQTPPETHFWTMYFLLLSLNIVMATNDIAVDGYATDILLPNERPWGNTIQSGARFLGLLLGGGLLLFFYGIFDWALSCALLAVCVFLLSIPVLLHRELPSEYADELPTGQTGKPGGIWSFLRRPRVLWLLPVLIAPTTFAFTGIQMRMAFFTDLGIDPRTMGTILFRYAYPVGFAGTMLCGYFLHRSSPVSFLRLFCCLSIGLALFCALLSPRPDHLPVLQTAIVLSLDNILVGGVQIWAYTQMMRVSAGQQSGMGFAVLSSLFLLVPMLSAPAFGALGDRIGFPSLYLLLSVLMSIGFLFSETLLLFRKQLVFPQGLNPAQIAGRVKEPTC